MAPLSSPALARLFALFAAGLLLLSLLGSQPAAADTVAPPEPEVDESSNPPAEDALPSGDALQASPETTGEPAEQPETSDGQADLDKATQLKLTARDGKQINDVIQLLASAMKKGLDEENNAFAKQMLASTLMERGQGLASILLQQPLPDPAEDPRWLQLRLIALSDLASAVELDPAELEAWLLIGRLQLLPAGDKTAAVSAFTKIIDADNAEDKLKAEAYVRRAVAQEDENARLADLSGAVEALPEQIEYRLLRARQQFSAESYDEALADIDKAIEIEPDNYAAHELRALVLRGMDRTEQALEALERASELKADSAMPYLQRGELFGQLGNFEQAIAEATKAIDLDDSSPLGYLLRADLYLRNEQFEEALADAEKLLELNPGLVSAIWLKARAYDGMDSTRKALEQLEQLAEALPGQAEIELQIGLYALKLEMPRRAIAALDRAIEAESDNALLYRFRADSYLNIGEHSKAIADYEQAHQLAPEDSGVLNNLAWTLATSPDDAVRDGQRSVELATQACKLTDYQTAHILSTLAAAYAETGDFEQAKEWAQKAVELDDEENEEQISEELASYERGEPWRERQQLDAGEREGAEPSDDSQERGNELEKPSSSKPAPRRSIDF